MDSVMALGVGTGLNFKEMCKSNVPIQDLQSIIDRHFNLPHVKLLRGKNGGLYLKNLFNGIPDDVEGQDHESFNEINLLLGWIDGDIDLPAQSKPIVPALSKECSDFHESETLPVTQAEVSPYANSQSKAILELDESPDLAGSGTLLDDGIMFTDERVKSDEKQAMIECMDEPVVIKVAAELDAHQVFDGMPLRKDGHGIGFDISGWHKSVLDTCVSSDFCLKLQYFDPGGEFVIGDSQIAIEDELANELINRYFAADQNDLKGTNMLKMLNKLSVNGKMMRGYTRTMCIVSRGFDSHLSWHVKRDLKHVKFRYRSDKVDFHHQLETHLKFRELEVAKGMMISNPGGVALASLNEKFAYPRKSNPFWCWDVMNITLIAAECSCLSLETLGGMLIFDPGGEKVSNMKVGSIDRGRLNGFCDGFFGNCYTSFADFVPAHVDFVMVSMLNCCEPLKKFKDEGLLDGNGKLLGSASSSIQIWKKVDYLEQSSMDIWLAIYAAVRSACSLASVNGDDVKGISSAATCSLVAVEANRSPVTISFSGDPRRIIIVWLDHRAVKQAKGTNSLDSPVLQYCGGTLLWVKENSEESWSFKNQGTSFGAINLKISSIRASKSDDRILNIFTILKVRLVDWGGTLELEKCSLWMPSMIENLTNLCMVRYVFDPGGAYSRLMNICRFEIILEDKDVLGRKYCNRNYAIGGKPGLVDTGSLSVFPVCVCSRFIFVRFGFYPVHVYAMNTLVIPFHG